MLSRRVLIGSAATLAAGCGGLDLGLPGLGPPREIPVTWVSSAFPYLNTGPGFSPPKEQLQRVVRELHADSDGPHSPSRGRYRLTLRYIDRYAEGYAEQYLTPELEDHATQQHDDNPTPEQKQFSTAEHLAEWLEEVEADLVTLGPEEARDLGEMGVLLPLDRFGGANGSDFAREFYSSVLEPFHENGALYALPVGANPLLLFYDADYFAQMGVAPPDDTWDWDVLKENALRLTQREEDGTVSRWGLETLGSFVWWALWQNKAELTDALTTQCRLQEPPAIEAIEFVRELIHTHRVSPAALGVDLARLVYSSVAPPAMVYAANFFFSSHLVYRRAALPRGKVHSVPVDTDPGIAIVAQTANPEVAYRGLRGLVRAMQPYVNVPAEREGVARLKEIRRDLLPDEVAAIQQSMEHGRVWPQSAAQNSAMYGIMESIVRGDDVTSAVNHACSVLYENR